MALLLVPAVTAQARAAERIKDDVYNCAVFIDHKGRICGKYHKMQFAEGYHPSWWFNRLRQHRRAFDTPYGRAGMMICNDRWNPKLGRIPVLDGARFLLIPSCGSASSHNDKAVLSHGQRNDVPVVQANVGVTLVVDGGRIDFVDRLRQGITFGQINCRSPNLQTVPLPISPWTSARRNLSNVFGPFPGQSY